MKIQEENAHLTAKEISRWLVEGPWQRGEEHLRSCAACEANLAEARAPLTVFRSAVVAWSEARIASQPVVRAERSARLPFMNWLPAFGVAVTVAILAATLVGLPLFHRHQAQQQAATGSVPDAVLIDQVDEEVSEAVPDALAPLTDLVGWDSGDVNAPSSKPVVKKKAAGAAKRKVVQ